METENTIKQKPLLLTKEGRYVYITNRELDKTVRFDLSSQQMERKKRKSSSWKPVKQQFKIFKDLDLDDIEFEDDKFRKLLKLSIKTHKKARNLSTYISSLDKVLVFEPWIQQGFECSLEYYHTQYGFSIPQVGDIPKPYLKMLKEQGQLITPNFSYKAENSKMFELALVAMEQLDFSPEQRQDLFNGLKGYGVEEAWDYLVNDKNFQPKALIGYLTNYLFRFEGLEFREAISTLRDYYRMADRIGRNVEKYPKYLRSMHDIIQANYKSYKKEYDKEAFLKIINPELEYKSKEFQMVNPQEPRDIVQEGTDNNHCVGSYVDDILAKKTYIIFLRKTNTKEEPEQSKKSLVTVELDIPNKKIVQARGSYNRAPTPEEKSFLEEYAKKLKMELDY